MMNEIFWKAPERERFDFFQNMSNDEAQAFFDQYLDLGDERMGFLNRSYYQTGGGNESDLDFSPDSLIPLWIWAAKHLQRREFTAAELKRILSLPDWFRQDQLAKKPLSEASLILINDIAYYFAEVLIRNLKGVCWKICKTKIKRYAYDNQPILDGFQIEVDPRGSVKGGALKTLDGEAGDQALLEAYTKCVNLLKE